ncbi:hypothetical protein [Caballeronia glathei]|uniref:hypothetical protein n=1 Tax=Caballeronia glathei TaxID=60547 RepID=UPI000B2174A5|nr:MULTISPECIES: hypothetical protein [Burkholderiaceae]
MITEEEALDEINQRLDEIERLYAGMGDKVSKHADRIIARLDVLIKLYEARPHE